MEQVNIGGKRSGSGFVAQRQTVIAALERVTSPLVEACGVNVGRRGFVGYLKALGGSNVLKVAPYKNGAEGNGPPPDGVSPSASVIAGKDGADGFRGLRVVCGAHEGRIAPRAWGNEKDSSALACAVRVAPREPVAPNLGGLELAEALGRVLPFVASDASRPALACVLFRFTRGGVDLAVADGYRLSVVTLPLPVEGEGVADGQAVDVLVEAKALAALPAALRRAYRVRLGYEPGSADRPPRLVVATEAGRHLFDGQSGTFPDYRALIPTDYPDGVRADARELAQAAATLMALAGEEGAVARVTMLSGRLILERMDATGTAEVAAQGEGVGVTAVNLSYLSQAARVLGGMVAVSWKDAEKAIRFQSDAAERCIILTMPVQDTSVAAAHAAAVGQPAPDAQTVQAVAAPPADEATADEAEPDGAEMPEPGPTESEQPEPATVTEPEKGSTPEPGGDESVQETPARTQGNKRARRRARAKERAAVAA